MPLLLPIRHAWRSLRRSPGFTAAAVLTLGIGIAATVAIFAVVDAVLLRPLPYGNPDRLVGLWHDLPPVSIHKANQTAATYLTYRRLSKQFEDMGIYQRSSVNVVPSGGDAAPLRAGAAYVTASLIPTLGVSPLMGRTFSEADDVPDGPAVVVISEGMWRSTFGADPEILGRSLEVNGRSREVVGVMPARFRFPEAGTQVWLPLQLDPANAFPGGFNYDGIGRLRPGVSPDAAQRELAALLPRIVEGFPNMAPGMPTQYLLDQAKPVPMVVPMRDDVTGGIRRNLWIVAAAAGLVLLVACANVGNLVLVRADGRQRELAVREALGAGRLRVLTHFLAESGVIVTIAGVLGFAAAWVAVRALVVAGPAGIPRLAEVSLDWRTLAFTALVGVLVALVCSVIPALRMSAVPLARALREGGRGSAGRSQQRLRGAMVIAQIALALVALAGSGLLLRSFRQLTAVRPGFDATGVSTLWLSLPSTRYAGDSAVAQFYARLQDRVAAIPGVGEVGLASRLPLMERGMNQSPLYPDGDDEALRKVPPLQIYTVVDAGYFRALHIPLVAGSAFQSIESQRSDEAIISQQTAVQFWKDSTGQAALGRLFRPLPGAPPYRVIGVAGDVRDTSLAALPSQTVYLPVSPDDADDGGPSQRTLALVVRTRGNGELPSLVPSIQRVVRELDPTLPTFDVRSMRAVMNASTAQLSFTSAIIGGAAIVTLLLGGIGLYGVMAYIVTLRRRELGVRMALGARPAAVAGLMTRQGLVLTGLGIVTGLVLFVGLSRFLRSFLYGVTATDPMTLIGAGLVLVAVSVLATWTPARRAARVDPAETLRAE